VFANLGQNNRTQFLFVVVSKTVLRPSLTSQGSVGAGCTHDYATRSAESPRALVGTWSRANPSCGDGKVQCVAVGLHLAVFEFLGNHTECERLGFYRRFLRCCTVYRNTGELGNIGDPAPISFTKQPYRKLHMPHGTRRSVPPTAGERSILLNSIRPRKPKGKALRANGKPSHPYLREMLIFFCIAVKKQLQLQVNLSLN